MALVIDVSIPIGVFSRFATSARLRQPIVLSAQWKSPGIPIKGLMPAAAQAHSDRSGKRFAVQFHGLDLASK
jgi:hypothetical protein